MLTIDCESEGGAWRRELLARPLTVAQLRDMVEELEHCLKVSRAEVARLNEELQKWNLRRTD